MGRASLLPMNWTAVRQWPQIRCALSRGFAISGWNFAARPGVVALALLAFDPWLISSAPFRLRGAPKRRYGATVAGHSVSGCAEAGRTKDKTTSPVRGEIVRAIFKKMG